MTNKNDDKKTALTKPSANFRKKVEEKNELKDLLLKANKLAKIGSWNVDLVRQTIYWNDMTREIHEAEIDFVPDLATGINFYKEGPSRELITQKVKEAIELGKPWDEELEIITVKNNIRWIRTIGETELVNGKCVKIYGSFQDITERKIAEETLKQKNKFIESIINASPSIIYLYDIEERKNVFVNYGIQTNLGYTDVEIKEMGNQILPALMHPEDFETYLSDTFPKYSAIKDKEIITHEFRMKNKSGDWKWFNCKESVFLRKPNGIPKEIFGIITDITELIEAQDVVKKNNERFELIASTTNDALWEWNFETGELWANERHQHLYGLEDSDPVPEEKTWQQKIHLADREKVIANKKIAFESDTKVWTSEYRFETKNGFINVYDRCYIIRNAHGKAIRATGTMIDITERIKAEIKLKENENYLSTILNTQPECVKILNRKGELVSINPAGLAMIEADNEQQVMGYRISKLIDKKYLLDFTQLSKQVFNGNSGSLQFEITGLKGGHRWLETHAVPLKDISGNIVNLLGVTRDITQRKKAETEIGNTTNQLRKLTAHLQTIREEERKRIAREIHDELGQQLTAIKMDTVWIDKQIPPESVSLKHKLQNMIELLDSSHQSVRKILNELRPAALDGNGLLDTLEWLGKQFTETCNTPVRFSSNQSIIKLPQEITICIFRVYQEALTNIMRYAGASKVVSSLKILDESIVLTIQDNGKGFNTEALQSKNSFGLLGMKERVHSLNGAFDLISLPDKGTKIIINLPHTDLLEKPVY